MTDRKSVRQTGRSTCYFCGSEGPIEEHHIIPRRHDGSDSRENLVDLCPTCHERLELLYDNRFYSDLGVKTGRRSPETRKTDRLIEKSTKPLLDEEQKYAYIRVRNLSAQFEDGNPPRSVVIESLHRDPYWDGNAAEAERALDQLYAEGEILHPNPGEVRPI